MSDPHFFTDKTILVTGAAGGVGRATSLLFARQGAKVVAFDIDVKRLTETADLLAAEGGRCLALEVDITSRAAVEGAVARAARELGDIDFLFNCAGAVFRRVPFLEIDDALLEATFALNLKGTFLLTQAVLPGMLDRARGVIVNVASMSHMRGGAGGSVHYAAAKGAVLSMTLGVAREFADRGIRCLSISPATINTPFQTASDTPAEMVAQFKANIPMKRFAEPEEIAELVLFMCSDRCEFMTADTVYVSGGSGYR